MFPKAGEEELRIHRRDTVLEYEESMRVWEEMKDTGKLCTSDTDLEEEDELTGEELLRALDKAAAAADPARAPKAESMGIDWPKRVLRQTILVSSIAAEILTDPGRADWDESCYEECRKLLVQETTRMGDIAEDRGTEEIPVLVDWEVQHWVAEALEGAKQASSLVGDRIVKIGAQRAGRDEGEGPDKRGSPSLAAKRARQAVLDATKGDPISHSQLERLVKLALGKMTYPRDRGGKAVVACVSATEGAGSGKAAQARPEAPGEVAPDDQGGPKARAEERESRRKEAGRTDPSSTDDRDVERSATFGGEVHQETAVSNGRPGVQWEASEDKGERRNLAVLTLKVSSALA